MNANSPPSTPKPHGDAVPAYDRVKKLVTAQIRADRWVEGDQLPSEHQFVAALGLSRMTINRALRELTADGLIVRQAGVGTFVAATKKSSPCSRSAISPTRSPVAATATAPK